MKDNQIYSDWVSAFWVQKLRDGTTAEERRLQPPKNPNKNLKEYKDIFKDYHFKFSSLFTKSEILLNEKSGKVKCEYQLNDDQLQTLFSELAKCISSYPSISGIDVYFNGFHSITEGKNSGKKIRNYLVFIHKTVTDIALRTWFIEPVLGTIRSHRNDDSDIWKTNTEISQFFGSPEATEIFLKERYPDNSSLQTFMNQNWEFTFPDLHIRFCRIPKKISPKVRRKGYDDKGYIPPPHKTKSSIGQSEMIALCFNCPELVNEKGELIMNKNEETSLLDLLVEVEKRSLYNFLEFLNQMKLAESGRLISSTEEEILTILQREDLTEHQKVKEILNNEKSKISKPRKLIGKYFDKNGELREVYSDSPREIRKIVGTGNYVDIQTAKTINRKVEDREFYPPLEGRKFKTDKDGNILYPIE